MKVMKLKAKHVSYLDWNHTVYLNFVKARQFIKNNWTHVEFQGKVIPAYRGKRSYSNNTVTFTDPVYTEMRREDNA